MNKPGLCILLSLMVFCLSIAACGEARPLTFQEQAQQRAQQEAAGRQADRLYQQQQERERKERDWNAAYGPQGYMREKVR
jgi:predicted small lipoprotein YifL